MLVKVPANSGWYSYDEYDLREKLEEFRKEMLSLETKPYNEFTDEDSDRLNVVYDAVNEISAILSDSWRR